MLLVETRRQHAHLRIAEPEVFRLDQIRDFSNPRRLRFFRRQTFEQREELERGAIRGNVAGVDAQLEIARQRFFQHDARDRWSIRGALTNDERDLGEIVILSQHETFDFARDRADFGVAIAAFEITNLAHERFRIV